MNATAPLTYDEVLQIKNVLRDLDPTAIQEKRRFPRQKTALELYVRKLAPGARHALFKVLMVNTSKRGVGILAPRVMNLGERFVLPLRFDDGGGWLVLCSVRNRRKLAGGHWKIGAEFLAWVEDESGKTRIPAEWFGDV